MSKIIGKTPLFYSLDIETLGMLPESPIIEIGICAVYALADKSIDYQKHSTTVPFLMSNPRIDTEALKFHLSSPNGIDLIKSTLSSEGGSPAELAAHWQMLIYDIDPDPDGIWFMRGPQFDQTALEKQLPADAIPWKYYNIRCQRTLDKLLAPHVKPMPIRCAVAHRAEDDAFRQAQLICHQMSQFSGQNPLEWVL